MKAPGNEIYGKLTQGTCRPTCRLQLCRYLQSFSCCCLSNLRNSAKFYENLNL